MMERDLIRNVSIVGDHGSGKSTLLSNLLQNSSSSFENQQPQQIEQQLSTTTTTQSQLYHCKKKLINQINQDDQDYCFNLLDCPGRVELSSDVSTSLRLSDGILMVLDSQQGLLGLHSEMALRQAILHERIQPIALLNKLDALLLSEQSATISGGDDDKYLEIVYQMLYRMIESINVVVCTYCSDKSSSDKFQLSPPVGNVAFGSALGEGWSFTLNEFVKLLNCKEPMDGIESSESLLVVDKLWGDHFYDKENKQWVDHSMDGKLERGFCQFVLKPIQKMLRRQQEANSNDRCQQQESAVDSLMVERLPIASDCIFNMMVQHLPSPIKAQRYRIENIYTGTPTDTIGCAISNCDPNGPLMIYISKLVIGGGVEKNKTIAIGRIFSGSIRNDSHVRILGPASRSVYQPRCIFEDKQVKGLVSINGSSIEPIEEASCGTIVGLEGIEQFLIKSGTITESTNMDSSATFKDLSFPAVSSSCLVSISIEPEQQSKLPTLINGMNKIVKCDPTAEFTLDENTGEKIIGVSSELHLQSILDQFKELYPSVAFRMSEPIPCYQETITNDCLDTTLTKSPNKHNRYYMNAQQLEDDLATDIERGAFSTTTMNGDFKKRAQILCDQYGWDVVDGRKIWAFGPDNTGPNVFVDQTRGVQYLNEIKDYANTGFQTAVKEGPLCGEVMRGVRFNLQDVTMVSDSMHRGGGQIIPTVRRGCHAAFLGASPTLAEPIYLVDLQCEDSNLSQVYSILNQRRGMLIEENSSVGSKMINLKAYLPVVESFGISERFKEKGIFAQFVYDHWQRVYGDPWDASSFVGKRVADLRLKKGLSETIPTRAELMDRL